VRARAGAGVLVLLLLLTACGRPATVSVLYAASLTAIMQRDLAPAFQAATGDRLVGLPGGSLALAHQIADGLQQADVFVSAAPSANAALGGRDPGWYVTFAAAPLVLGYNPGSPAARQASWPAILAVPGLRLGGTDPRLDPKGQLTQAYLQAQHLAPPIRVFPEEDLVGRLQAGQLDAAFFYRNEAVAAGIPYIALPAAPAATYTVTVPRGARHPAAGLAFARFLLSDRGQALLRAAGLEVGPPQVHGTPPAGLGLAR
jgi:molybdate/tungstate transport system substrate-binding protein